MLTASVASVVSKNGSYLRACLEQTGLVKSIAEWGIEPARHPAPGELVPDVVLIDLTRELESCFEFAAHLRKLRPSVCLVGYSPVQNPSPGLLIQAMRSGMQEFLSHPIEGAALRDLLQRHIQQRGPEAEPEKSEKAIAVLGAKGGVGTTTVAVNLAVQLAAVAEKRAVLLDLARPLGLVSLLLDLQPRFSVRAAFENLDRLDSYLLAGLLTRHKSGLEVLGGVTDPDEWQHIPVPVLPRVVNVAQNCCDYLVIDLGSVYTSEWSPVLHLAKTILLVTQADVCGLWSLERHLSALASFGLDPAKVQIIINRWHRPDEEALKAFEKKTKRSIFARIPNDFRRVSMAVNLGAPLAWDHNDPLVSRFRQMASQLVGVSLVVETKRGSLFNFISSISTR
jgi:pilus assembly protein CpaE